MIDSVILSTSESEKKQIKAPVYASEYCNATAEKCNARHTKGTIFYEVVLFSTDEFTDKFSRVENNVVEQIENQWGSAFRELIYNVRVKSEKGSLDRILDMTEVDDPTEIRESDNYNIPSDLYEQMLGRRYIGRDFGEWVVEFEASAFTSRSDRVECMVQLLDWEEKNMYPEHDVSQAIVECDTERFTNIDDLHQMMVGEFEFNPDNITLDELYDWTDAELKARGLGRGRDDAVEQRVWALERAIENSSEHMSKGEMQEVVMDAYNIGTPRYTKKYVEQIDVEVDGGIKVEGLDEILVDNIFGQHIDKIENDAARKGFANMGPYGAAAINRETLESIEGTYESEENAKQALVELKEVREGEYQKNRAFGTHSSSQKQLRKHLFDSIQEMIEEQSD